MLEEVVKLVSPGPAGAAKLDEEDEMAKVAKRTEELEGSFMIKEVDNEEIKTSTSGKDGYDESWERKMRMSTSGKWKKLYTRYGIAPGETRMPSQSGSLEPRLFLKSVRLERPVTQASWYFPHVQYLEMDPGDYGNAQCFLPVAVLGDSTRSRVF